MGKSLENWLTKARVKKTGITWKYRFLKFSTWASPHLKCSVDEVDEVIRRDFENMSSNLFADKYKDLLTKYIAYLNQQEEKSNTILGILGSVRSFFANEATEIKIRQGTLPSPEMAMNEHRFTLPELRAMWHIGDLESKARLSLSISLGWSIGDFLKIKPSFLREVIKGADKDGFVCFDYVRGKTKARVRGILTPDAVQDLKAYLPTIQGEKLWTSGTIEGVNYWIKHLAEDTGIKQNGTVRFHLLRKYVFDTVSSQVGIYEAKLLVGKKIDLADETYLHGLQDRLLERYKKFAYPLLKLDGSVTQNGNSQVVKETLEKQSENISNLREDNIDLRAKLDLLQKALQEEKTLRENTEIAFNKSVDKLNDRIKNLEIELDMTEQDEEANSKKPLFEN